MRLDEIDYGSLNKKDRIVYWICNIIVTFIIIAEIMLL